MLKTIQNHTPEYQRKFEVGMIFQDFVYELLSRHGINTVAYTSGLFQKLKGENKARIEIKFDSHIGKTGNVCIEVEEKSDRRNPNWIPSGIHNGSVEYIIGNYYTIYRITTKILLAVKRNYRINEDRGGTAKFFLVPEVKIEEWATEVYRLNCSDEMVQVLKADYEERKRAMAELISAMKCDPNQGSLFEPKEEATT